MPETKKLKAPPPKDLLPARRGRGRPTRCTEAVSEELCMRISCGDPKGWGELIQIAAPDKS